MPLSNRERQILVILLITVGAAALYYLVLGPYFDWRGQLASRTEAQSRELEEAQRTIEKASQLHKLLAEMGPSIKSDPSAAEAQLFHLIHDWEQQSAMAGASFQRSRTSDQHGFTCLSFHLSATGMMPAVARLLYRVETAHIPLSVDGIQVTPRLGSADELEIDLRVSTLCRQISAEASETHGDLAVTGGQP